MPSVIHPADKLAHLDADIDLALTLRDAFSFASQSKYIDAAKQADRLKSLTDAREKFEEPVLARASRRTSSPPRASSSTPRTPTSSTTNRRPAHLAAPSPNDTPYGDFLRVRTSKDDKAEWAIRSKTILAAISPDRREDLDALYQKPKGCQSIVRQPQMDGPRDLYFAVKLEQSLAPDNEPEASATARGCSSSKTGTSATSASSRPSTRPAPRGRGDRR